MRFWKDRLGNFKLKPLQLSTIHRPHDSAGEKSQQLCFLKYNQFSSQQQNRPEIQVTTDEYFTVKNKKVFIIPLNKEDSFKKILIYIQYVSKQTELLKL